MNLEQIDTSTTAGKAEVMRLAAEGRRVAAARRYHAKSQQIFDHVSNPSWNWDICDFGIISEPVGPDEVWLTYSENGALQCTSPEKPRWEVSGDTHVRYIRADLAGEKG